MLYNLEISIYFPMLYIHNYSAFYYFLENMNTLIYMQLPTLGFLDEFRQVVKNSNALRDQ